MFGISAINLANVLYYGFYGLVAALVLYTLFLSVQVFRRRITWGQARYMGIPFTAFVWIQFVFYLVIFEGAFGVVSLFYNMPFWLDLIIILLIVGVVGYVYVQLTKRATFKPRLFVPLVLIPLGIPGGHLLAELTQIGAVEIVQTGAISFLKKGELHSLYDVVNVASDDVLKVAASRSQNVQGLARNTVIGIINFANTHTIGRLGDYLTARRLTGMGYTKLPSKHSVIHGIDGVYVRFQDIDGVSVQNVVVVENKVGTARLASNQMSDIWLKNAAEKLRRSTDAASRRTGQLLGEAMAENPDRITRQLWHHDLVSGKTTVTSLDMIGKVREVEYTWTDHLIENTLRQFCIVSEAGTCIIR